ncbi:glycosyltransferase family 4 protein [Paenibacillus sp. 7516]|uniref:glycosyltransferase family 4 protein n=1 Tax=Paenibacillus sp. 7516 TaxID=2022549 RepID=UPI000BA5FF8D|nr:glycosyltransferase family 4 protein [Paenibacillus sp. 7516]PAF29215.1 glycosyl transferase [Paenibacillus sp. 7516]
MQNAQEYEFLHKSQRVNRVKVLFTFFVPSGGVDTLNRLRTAVLQRHGIEAHLLYLYTGSGLQNSTGTPVFTASNDEEIRFLIHSQRYDAIIVTSDISMPGRLRGLGYTGRIIFEAQGLGTRDQALETIQMAIPYLQAHCDAAVLPPTDHLLNMFIHICPWLHRFVIPNMLDTDTFAPVSVDTPPYPVLAWVGRLEQNKNWREYLSISSKIIKKIPKARLWLFHDPSLANPEDEVMFRHMLAEYGLEDRIGIFVNVPHSQMPTFYSMIAASGGIMLSTSLLEGFGYAVAEAISCGCPVLSTDSDGVRSFITHNKTGKFYPLGNVNAAVDEAVELMHNHQLREYIREQGREHMTASFSPDRYAISFREMMTALRIFS